MYGKIDAKLHSTKPMQLSTVLRNRYKIIQFLGSGGFGDTYLAEDLDLPGHPTCVVKQLKPKNPDPSILQTARVLFDREAKVLYTLGNAHNQVPRLFAHFEENGEFYLVQEYIEGHPLSTELLPGQPWTEPNVVQLLKEILEVLGVVHQHGVIHRDIKPQNLMRRSQDKKIVLIDFGAVKEISALDIDAQGHTTSTIAIGSAGYMPPEQAHGNPQRTSDIYAVGVLGIQALLGRMPQQDPSTGDLLWKNLVSVSPEFADTLERMTRYQFRDRYQSAELILSALTPTIIAGQSPPLSIPPSNPQLEATIVNPRPPNSAKSTLPITVVTPHPQPTASIVPKIGLPRWQIYLGVGCVSAIAVFFLGYLAFNFQNNIRTSEFIQNVKKELKKQDNSATIDGLVRIFDFKSNYVVADDSRGANYRNQGKLDEAIENFSKAITLDPNTAINYSDRGSIYYDQNNQDKALDDFNAAIKLDSRLAVAFNNRAYVYFNKDKEKEALDDFNKAIELEPELAVSYNGRGVIYHGQNENQKALDDYNKAIGINPKYAVAYHNRGTLYLNQGKLDESLSDFNKAIELEPRLAVSYYMRSIFYEKQGKQSTALSDLNKAIELDPKLAIAYYDRGLIYDNEGNQQDALNDFDKAIELDPEFADAYLVRGNFYYNQNNSTNAFSDYNKAVQLNPKLASAYLGRANVYYNQNKYNDALENYTRAIDLDPKLAHAFFGRGNVNAVLKNKSAAIADYQKAAALYKEQGKDSDYQDAMKQIKILQ
jgi:tetratricopeptide (TPR) repeat protein/tRNA A-37 threonylcarbamoyl transferase component Bud32